MMSKHKLIQIFILIASILVGCNRSSLSPTLMDESPFTGNPCAAPCWYGLYIAKSDEMEVLSILKSLKFIDQNSLKIESTSIPDFNSTNLVPGKRITANCANSETPCLILNIASGKLRDIRSILNYKITVDEVIKSIGNPDKVGYTTCCTESMACGIQLFWIQKQLVLSSRTFSGRKGCDYSRKTYSTGLVDANLEIAQLEFFPIEIIGNLIADTEMVGNYQGINPKK